MLSVVHNLCFTYMLVHVGLAETDRWDKRIINGWNSPSTLSIPYTLARLATLNAETTACVWPSSSKIWRSDAINGMQVQKFELMQQNHVWHTCGNTAHNPQISQMNAVRRVQSRFNWCMHGLIWPPRSDNLIITHEFMIIADLTQVNKLSCKLCETNEVLRQAYVMKLTSLPFHHLGPPTARIYMHSIVYYDRTI